MMEKNELYSVVFVYPALFVTVMMAKILKNEDCVDETFAVTLHPEKKRWQMPSRYYI